LDWRNREKRHNIFTNAAVSKVAGTAAILLVMFLSRLSTVQDLFLNILPFNRHHTKKKPGRIMSRDFQDIPNDILHFF
jgi:hypothetical protein